MTAEDKRELLQAVGIAVVAFSSLEEYLREAIFVVSGVQSPAVTVLTAGLRFRTLVRTFAAVCKECARPYTRKVPEKAVRAFCTELNAINTERDLLVHSVWTFDDSDQPAQRMKWLAAAEKGVRLQVTPVSVPEVHELVRRIRQAEDKLWEIVSETQTLQIDEDLSST